MHCAVNIDYAADVVVIDDRHFVIAIHGGDVGENFLGRHGRGSVHAGSAAIDGYILQILDGVHFVLGSLRDQVVVHAVLPIEKEHRRDLEAAGEAVQHTSGHVALSKSALRCLGPVDGDIERGVIEGLLDANVGQARDAAKLGEHGVGKLITFSHIVAFELNIERSGQSEVQDLGGDIGGQKIEGGSGKDSRQFSAKCADIIRGRPMHFPSKTP